MGFGEVMDKIRERSRNRKELIRDLDERTRIEELVGERRKSANQRELERFFKEKNEEDIKFQLDKMRKMRRDDIQFNHNPLNVKNVTNHTDWEVLKERNLFKGKSSMFSNHESVLNNNPKLLQNSGWLMK